MTRYSRSVIPGRPGGEPQDNPNLDRMVFGAKRRSAAANDEPDFLPPVDEDEADLLVARSNTDRRKSADRRSDGGDRRKSAGRRLTEYAPLNEGGRGSRMPDDSKRGPLLLAGALLIVIVFGVVVWNAYSDGLAGDEAEIPPELASAGAFKTPPRVVEDSPVVTEPVEAPAETLEGGAPTTSVEEERPAPPPVEAAVTPPPSKVTAPPPAPLKAPVQTAVTPPAKAEPAKIDLPKPAATPAPAVAAAPDTYKPAFAAYGDHVVQLAATSTEAAATTEWARLSKAHPELLSGAETFIIQADVSGKTVYRLRIGSFASKADAIAFCTAFKARGGNCLPAVK